MTTKFQQVRLIQWSLTEKRVKDNHKVPFTYDDSVPELIGQRCIELERGARMVDALITNTNIVVAYSNGILGYVGHLIA